MTSSIQRPVQQGPSDGLALLRRVLGWLLVAVLAVDLISSPLHAHRHDGEWSAAGLSEATSAHAADLPAAHADRGFARADHDEDSAVSHSIVALRTLVEVNAAGQPLDDGPAAAPGFEPARWLPGIAPSLPWPPDRHRAGPVAFRSLPPHGRAPPLPG